MSPGRGRCVVLSAVLCCCLFWRVSLEHEHHEPSRRLAGANGHESLSQMPSIINLLRKPSCSGNWQEAVSITRTIVGLMISGCTFVALLFLTATVGFDIVPKKLDQGQKLVLLAEFIVSLLVGWSMSKAAMTQLPADTHWHIFLPEDWHQVMQCTYIHSIGFPESFFPLHAGIDLPEKEKTQRMEYYLSLLLWLTLGACVAGGLVTLLGRCTQRLHEVHVVVRSRSSREYQPVELSDGSSDDDLPAGGQVPLWFHLWFHVFSASLAISSALGERMDMQAGVCWEVYVLWFAVQLSGSVLQAMYMTCTMPSHAPVPLFIGPIVLPVLPVTGEPLDIFKDWLFVGLALSRRTCLSCVFAVIAIGILLGSNIHMRHHYPRDLSWMLMPVKQLCLARRKESFLAHNTAPVKLALALTEDLPQACVQSLFVAIYGGSSTQVLFIALSCMKILACVVLRGMVLENEDRYGEAFEAEEFYYRVQYSILSVVLPNSPWTLQSQSKLADALYHQGRHLEEVSHREAVAAICTKSDDLKSSLSARSRLAHTLSKLDQHVRAVELLEQVVKECGHRDSPDALWFQDNLAMALSRVGKHEEALQLKRKVVQTRCEEFEPNHPHTLWSQSSLAKTLTDVGYYAEALAVEEKLVTASQETMGANHPDTLWAQDNLAITLDHLGRHDEALDLKKEVLKRRKIYFGPKHKFTLWSTGSVADTLLAMGEVDEALKLRRREVKDRQKIHGIIFADTIEAQLKLATLLMAMGHNEEAVEVQDKVVKLSREAFGPNNPDTLRVERSFAEITSPRPTQEIWSFFSPKHLGCGAHGAHRGDV